MRFFTLAGVLAAAVATGAGCHRGPRTAEEAFLVAERAIAAGDGAAFYACLDRSTRWSIDSAFRDQRLMRTIILAKYPDEEQARALGPLAAAAEDDPARFFARAAKDKGTLVALRRRLGSVSGPILQKPDGDAAVYVARQDGQPLRFVHDGGGWGFAELTAEWQLERDRATHAVKTVRDNASLYQKEVK